ncbi:MAG: UDP-N-acetylglucosamine--N-acetylmuramyl-(pentapeptide) pyrophosphoryl-undecaprenol N-acetylglucosamine transferase [Gemmatimonadetes bacterium]|nr:UDP-N-acetylglucosamine--N-acetylmuramyl-(pentapeptide) pyrophosphoryl-undecaprenol N-acetylglucosamine transferase [Gemmatimonadota bacterium]
MRVLFAGGGTGGHLYPALNIASALRRLDPDIGCFFVGGERGIEARVLPSTGHDFRLLPLEPLYRQAPWRNWRFLANAPAVWSGLRRTFREFEPNLVVGTGGYVSAPALAWGHGTRRGVAIQEQNARPGLTTKMFAPRADQIHLGYPEAEAHLKIRDGAEVHTFGNPVRPPSRVEGSEGYDWPEGRILLVVGGSQGARALNERLLADLERAAEPSSDRSSEPTTDGRTAGSSAWPDDLTVVWVAGRDHADDVGRRVAALPWADRIRVEPFIQDLGRQLDRVTLALSRSGAMLVAELCVAGRPAVLVPLPTAAGDHQKTNALALHDAGAAEIREERELAPGELWSVCRELLADADRIDRMAAAAKARGRPDAADRIAEALLDLARRAVA